MRPVSYTLSAAGFGAWIPLDYLSTPFNVGIGVTLSDGATLTYDVEHTFDDIFNRRPISALSRAATVATLDFLENHGLVAGDWIQVDSAGAPFDGGFAVATVVDANTITYTVANSGPTEAAPASFARVVTARVFDHEFLVAQTTNGDGNYAFGCRACRLNVTAYTDGEATITIVQSGPR